MTVPDSACATLGALDVPTLYYVVRRIEERYEEARDAAVEVKRAGESIAVQECFVGRALEADNLSHVVRDIIRAHQQSLPASAGEGAIEGLVPSAVPDDRVATLAEPAQGGGDWAALGRASTNEE
jgi:hypothetical protein